MPAISRLPVPILIGSFMYRFGCTTHFYILLSLHHSIFYFPIEVSSFLFHHSQ